VEYGNREGKGPKGKRWPPLNNGKQTRKAAHKPRQQRRNQKNGPISEGISGESAKKEGLEVGGRKSGFNIFKGRDQK